MPRRDAMPAPKKVRWQYVVHAVCLRKRRFEVEREARVECRRLRDPDLRVYRCPFSDGPDHFHLGHTPNMRTLRKIATAIRLRAQEA